jgi:hypothetical protein
MDAVWNGLLIVAGGAVVTGAGFEAYALRSQDRGDTLSEHIRPWAKRHPGLFLIACGSLMALGAWLPGHILN